MKACENYIERIMDSIDGVLSEQEEQALQAHLASCEGCRGLYQAHRNIQDGILGMEEEAPENLSRAVMSAIRQEKEKSSPLYYLKRAKFTLIAVAACLIVVVAHSFGGFGSSGAEADSSGAVLEMRAAPEAAMEAPAAEPAEPEAGEGAAFMPTYDAVEETEEFAVEEAAPKAPETELFDEEIQEAQSDAVWVMSSVLDAMTRDSYFGDLVELFGFTEEKLYEVFPEAEKLTLSQGAVVYLVSRDAFEDVYEEISFGSVVSTDEPGEDVFLWLN